MERLILEPGFLERTIFIILFVTAAISIGIYLHKVQRKKQSNLKNIFITLAKENQLNITESESLNLRSYIGIDTNLKKLFYLKKNKDKEETVLIDLTEVKKCSLINISRSVKLQNGSGIAIDKLDLIFTFNNPSLPEQILNFYNTEEDIYFLDELHLLEKWEKIVNTVLKFNI